MEHRFLVCEMGDRSGFSHTLLLLQWWMIHGVSPCYCQCFLWDARYSMHSNSLLLGNPSTSKLSWKLESEAGTQTNIQLCMSHRSSLVPRLYPKQTNKQKKTGSLATRLHCSFQRQICSCLSRGVYFLLKVTRSCAVFLHGEEPGYKAKTWHISSQLCMWLVCTPQ